MPTGSCSIFLQTVSLLPRMGLVVVSILIYSLGMSQTVKTDLAVADQAFSRKEYQKAQTLYLANSQQLSPQQQYWLGICLYNDPAATNTTFLKGIEWFKKAADRGFTEAMNTIAYCYKDGRGVPKDLSQFISWAKRAAGNNSPWAMMRLAETYAGGEGVPQDLEQARQYLQKAMTLDDKEAVLAMAHFELYSGDTTKAYQYMEKAARRNYIPAMYEFGQMHEKGIGTGKPDYDEAYRWYYKIRDTDQFRDYYSAANTSRLFLQTKEPPTDLATVRPPLQKLVAGAINQYNGLRGKEIIPYNFEREIGSRTANYYQALIDIGFKNSYIKTSHLTRQQAGSVEKYGWNYSFYAELLKDAPENQAVRTYQEWATILKKVFPDWKVSEENSSSTQTGITTLYKTIGNRTYNIELRLMSSPQKTIQFTIKQFEV